MLSFSAGVAAVTATLLPSPRGHALPLTPVPWPQPIWLVPTAMNYDAVLEEGALAAQLAGAAKKSESLGGLAG